MGNIEEPIEILEVAELINVICTQCGIPTFQHNLSNDEVAEVCRWIGEHAPGSHIVEGELAISTCGFDTMMFITITEFSWFFEKHQLAMVWRN